MKACYLVVVFATALAAAACGGAVARPDQLSDGARKVVSARVAAAQGVESPFETKKPSREYAEALDRAANTNQDMTAISQGCCDETRRRDRDALDRLWNLSAAASRLRVSLEAFEEQRAEVVPADSDAGRKISTGGAPAMILTMKSPDGTEVSSEAKSPEPPAATDGQGRKVFKREIVLGAQWEDVRQSLKSLEELLNGRPPAR